MPTPVLVARVPGDLLEDARRTLGLPPGSEHGRVIRAAMEAVTGRVVDGRLRNKGGRPPKARSEQVGTHSDSDASLVDGITAPITLF